MSDPLGRVGGPDLMAALRAGDIKGEAERLKAATTLLESTFVEELYRVMREPVPDGMVSGGQGEKIFAGMLDRHVAEVTAGRLEDRGLGRAIYERFRESAGVREGAGS